MENKSSANLLFFDGSGTPALAKKPVFIQPGKSLTVTDSTLKVYLASGFPELTPQSDFPLSPALQLNSDLATFSDDELQQIGQAELKRLNSISCRSYIQNPDYRVVLLGSNPDSLTRFMETYGGVLEITPLLLKSHHKDYPTIDELHIGPGATGYTIEYTTRTPVDRTLCSYCGLCGPICPENCIAENLFLDLSKCSYCNECVKICPSTAIELYRAEKHALEIPAIIILDNLSVELPSNSENVYTPGTLDKLFANLIPVQIDEAVSLTPSLCQFSSNINSGCRICLHTCNHKAIAVEGDKLAVHHLNCTECGACLASCPTGALQYQRFDDKQFISWFASFPVPEACTIILGSEKHLHSLWWKKNLPENGNFLFVEYPNVQALTSMHLLFLLSIGAARVILLSSGTELQASPVGKQIQITNTISTALFGCTDRVLVATPDNIKTLEVQTTPLTQENKYNIFNYINRRDKLASILNFLLKQRTLTTDETPVLDEPVFAEFGSITCDADKCTHCGACLNDCRIEALTSDEESLTLNHSGILCVQCGTCAAVCPEDALSLLPGLPLESNFFRQQELTRAEAIKCRECGKAFGTKKSFEHVMAKLKSHAVAQETTNFFEYCDKCRVVKLFESHQT